MVRPSARKLIHCSCERAALGAALLFVLAACGSAAPGNADAAVTAAGGGVPSGIAATMGMGTAGVMSPVSSGPAGGTAATVGTGSAGVMSPVSGGAAGFAPQAGSSAAPAPSAGNAALPALDAGIAGSSAAPPEGDMDAGEDMPASGKPPFVADGEPLTGRTNSWTLIQFPNTQCRDGSSAGVFINLGSANKLMIFLEGGGRCADEQTCAALNPANISDGDLVRGLASAGVLDRSSAENPVRDWNWVVIPYCTGDRHGGANPDGDVPGVGPQKFVGYTNMVQFLKRIVPTFPGVTDVLFTGVSAGGFGVAYTAPLVQQAFPNIKIKPIIDSAPFVSTAVFLPCDQQKTRMLYHAEQTFLGECGASCPKPDDYWLDYGRFFARQFGDRPWGLISTTEDAVERAFFGIGVDDCTASLDLLNPAISGQAFRNELLALRTELSSSPGFATFYPDSDTHSFIAFGEFYNVRAGNVRLVDWFTQILNGTNPGHVGP